MAGGLGERTFLTPTGHPAVDQARVAPEADVRAKTQALHDPRTVALNQRVRGVDEPEDELDPLGHLQVDGDRAPSTGNHIGASRSHGARPFTPADGEPVHAGHGGAKVSQHHPRERAGADARHLDDADP